MDDKYKTKAQLVGEVEVMRRRVAELEASETKRKRTEEAIRKFKTITDQAGYGVAISNLEGNVYTGC